MDQHSLCCGAILLLLVFASLSSSSRIPDANISTSWINTPYSSPNMNRTKFLLNPILSICPHFACGFYCEAQTACLLAVVIHKRSSFGIFKPQLVWSANRNHPVKLNATLQLTRDGDLVLADADGTFVWSTNTSGKSVSGLNLTEDGNLVLFDGSNTTVWQSFDHPTDSLLVGQTLVLGQKLIANISPSNWSQGLYSLLFTRNLLRAYVETNYNVPTTYFQNGTRGERYIKYENGSFNWFTIPFVQVAQFMRLESDGRLKVYEFTGYDWAVVVELMTEAIGECGYPMACGKYGICSNGQCSCPDEANSEVGTFRQRNYRQPNLGCSPVTPISCDQSQYHSFLELKDTSYFGFYPINHDYGNASGLDVKTDVEDCKKSCVSNCSCKAVFYSYAVAPNSKPGCLLLFEAFSFGFDRYTMSTIFLKVQKPVISNGWKSRYNIIILGSSLLALFGVLPWVLYRFFIIRNKRQSEEDDEFSLVQVSGLPTRFSYEDLKSMTNSFTNKLGEGGFGSVFLGMSIDGTKIAVKRLDGFGQVKKSFLAEVQTIGSIHHVNLVRLIGFCAENSNRLLVYEYMSNGSLDRWIFKRHQELTLGWESRRKIIVDIAKGLAYLHEECRQKIYHLDIKPQNILLDENFEAKVSDFGLAKLIDKDQSQVVATMRGTPGYMAPEWLSSIITEKVDVYSFGVVVLEILCGRKNLDRSQPEEEMHLLRLFERKGEEGQLLDMVDKYNADMQLHGAEVVEMMKLAMWCLQSDYRRRPSMTVVVQVMEGLVSVQDNLDYNFINAPARRTMAATDEDMDAIDDGTPLIASVLSGPR
ncbi:hypothetical protein RHSIM_Rhsim06G0123700 [Rhododendron simsii]|uniref:Receptor-like serine/threonine-protein kinase n=1 Tax=Rhododendron simsii TaxID=118357 RepID=A0A834LHX8_RHOSS|nr:hypothetical protein RHSIM_Rhsim06G0123700 [Rhododendron simsii]